VDEHGIAPHVSVFDKSVRNDGTFSREEFTYDHQRNIYSCPGGKPLTTTGTLVNDGATILYCASKHDCQACALKSRCCPKSPARRVPRTRSRSHGKGAPRVDCARRSRCCSRTSTGFSSSTDSDGGGRTVRVTSSSSQQPPRTSESSRN